MKRILIVEDDRAVLVGLTDFIRSLGYEAIVARDGEEGLTLYRAAKPDLILLDLVLPKCSGMDVCRTIRDRGDRTPIIMVTAKGQAQDRVAGLDLGADDYVTKPFNLDELAARIRAVMRRTDEEIPIPRAFDLGDLHIDLGQFAIERDGERHELAARERDILALLVARRGEVVSRNDILDRVWGEDQYPTPRTVDNYIVSLRKKMEKDPATPEHLVSVRGVGYRLAEPI